MFIVPRLFARSPDRSLSPFVLFFEREPTAPRSLRIDGKRILDVTIALVALLVALPTFLGIMLLVKLDSSGPVFYGHPRIGRGGRTFRCWKFRTMQMNGDLLLSERLAGSAALRREWEETQKLHDDPRITPLGRILRKLSIDELPQFFNVLCGDMSVVGPRPVVESELTRYGSSVRHYLSLRPGITGMWQIGGRSDTSYARRVAFDRLYAQSHSIGLDLWIVLRTVPAVLASRGAH